MDLGRNYKDIYVSVKDDLLAFGDSIKITIGDKNEKK